MPSCPLHCSKFHIQYVTGRIARPDWIVLAKVETMRTLRLTASLVLIAFAISATLGFGKNAAQAQVQVVPNGNATGALFDAVHANDLEAVQARVAEGANVDARDRWGMTPVEIAIDREYFEVAHFLMSIRNFQAATEAREPRPSVVPALEQGTALAGAQMAIGLASFETGSQLSLGIEDNGAQTGLNDAPAIAWPVGQPNPFDPAAPAPGSEALIGVGVGLTSLPDPFADLTPNGNGGAVDIQ